MAINIRTTYPDQTDPESAALPFGTPRDVTTPGDNTGTPWKAGGLGGDLVGFIQSVLDAAGVVPNNTPESVSNPQILDALRDHLNPYGLIKARISWNAGSSSVVTVQPSIDGHTLTPTGSALVDSNGNVYGRWDITGVTLPVSSGVDFLFSVTPTAAVTTSFAASPASGSAAAVFDPLLMIRSGAKLEAGRAWIEIAAFNADTLTTFIGASFDIEITYPRF